MQENVNDEKHYYYGYYTAETVRVQQWSTTPFELLCTCSYLDL